MRMMMKVDIPVEAGNAAAINGTLGTTIQKILGEIKPEAAYFAADGGNRGCYLIVNMTDNSQIPALAEPFFLAFHARVSFQPVMTAEDLAKAAPAIQNSVKAYATKTAGH